MSNANSPNVPKIEIIREANRQIEHLSKCKCCIRHQRNKPEFVHLWVETSNTDADPSIKPLCICDCRHKARFICRNNYGWTHDNMDEATSRLEE